MADETDTTEVVDESIDTPVVEQTVHEAPELSEVEQIATEMGWTPKDRWKGEEDAWKPASDFIRATKDVNKSLRSDIKRIEKRLEGIGRVNNAMTERAIAEERRKWEAEHERAVDEGDKEGAKAASKELAKLESQRPVPEANEDAEAFIEKNASWWGKNTEATAYAVKRSDHYAAQDLSPSRQVAAVERDLRKHFPELFEEAEPKPQRQQPSVAQPQRTARIAPREKGYATLPPEARKACDEWVSGNKHRGAWVTKESWAQSYYETQEAANG